MWVADARRRRLVLVLGCLTVSALYLTAELLAGGPGFPLDDSWIHLQFARSVSLGDGLSYRAGELVGGSTSPLWTAVLSLFFVVPVSPLLGAKLAGIGLLVAVVLASETLAGELGMSPGLRFLTGLLVAATDWMVWSALSGMEILLFTLLTVWGLVLWGRARAGGGAGLPRALLVLGVAALARPEGLLLLLLAVVDELVLAAAPGRDGLETASRWLRLGEGLVLVVLVLVPVGLVYAAIQGSPFPGTLAVKTDGIQRLLPSLRHVYSIMGILFRPQPWIFFLAAAGILRLVERWGTSRDRGLLAGLWLIALPLAYSTLAPAGGPVIAGNFGRYFFPLLPPMVVLGVLGLEPLLRRLGGPPGAHRRRMVEVLVVLVISAPALAALAEGAGRYATNVANVEQSDVAAGRWIRQNLPAGAVLAVQDVGAVGYLTPNPLVDLAGIVTPGILPYIKGDKMGSHPSRLGGLAEFVRSAGADYLLVFPSSYGGVETLSSVLPGLVPLRSWRIEDNITMAGSELVLYRASWSRARP